MRNTITVTVQNEPDKVLPGMVVSGATRDQGKQFVLTEMPAMQVESWAIRVFLALASAGAPISKDAASAGLAGLAAIGLSALSFIRWEDAKPLLDEMMQCVQIVPDPNRPMVKRDLIDSDIEDVRTLLFLRKEIWKLHTGFLKAADTRTTPESTAQA